MFRVLLFAVLIATPLAAEYESNFGKVILAKSDVIIHGIAAAKRTRAGGAIRVELTVQDVIYGEEDDDEISILYTNRELLPEEEAVHALFALERLADGGYSLVGKPVLTQAGDPERDEKLSVAKAYVALEDLPADEKRTEAFWALLLKHVRWGGYAAENAAIELMFVANSRGRIIDEERFDELVDARDESIELLTQQARDDLKLAFQGMVEARVKTLKFKHVRRGETRKERREGASDLLALFDEYPRAFDDSDANLCDALAKTIDDGILKERVNSLGNQIRNAIRIREAEDRAEAEEARKKIEHAGK